jgi:hypothetical protein
LSLKSEKLVSSLCFFKCNSYRYSADPLASSSFVRGYYGPPGDSCWYCGDYSGGGAASSASEGLDTSTIWRCPANNLSFPMPLRGYFIDVCKGQPAAARSCQPLGACLAIASQNVTGRVVRIVP